jgi:dipeptidyl-peptidase-4
VVSRRALIAYTRVDETPVDVVPRFDIGPTGVTVVEQRYPRAGRPNARVQLFVAPVDGSTQPVEVDLGSSTDIYLARVRWSVDGRTLYVQRLSRDQKTLNLLAVDPATGAARALLTERSPHWINVKGDGITPLKDGSFLWTTERTGFRHVEHHGPDGRLIAAVTSGDWPVTSVASVDETRGLVFVLGSRETPLERHLYSASFRKPGAVTRLTQGAGWWSVTAPKGGQGFIGTYSDPDTPPQTALYDPSGRRLRWIEENALDADHPYAPTAPATPNPSSARCRPPTARPCTTPSPSPPASTHVAGIRPSSSSTAARTPSRSSASGRTPGTPVHRSGLRRLRTRQPRHGQSGVKFEAALDRRLGGVEVADQLAGVRWLKAQPWIDPARIGVSGWSYGGFMTLMMMTEPGAGIAAGAAGRRRPTGPVRHRLHRALHGHPERNPRATGRRRGHAAAEPPGSPAAAPRHGRRQRHLRQHHPRAGGSAGLVQAVRDHALPGRAPRHPRPAARPPPLAHLLDFFTRAAPGRSRS